MMCYPPTGYIMFTLKGLKFYGGRGPGGVGWGPDNPTLLLGNNSYFSLQGIKVLLCTTHLFCYIIELKHFEILSSYLLGIEL